jgi:hypothetical protein
MTIFAPRELFASYLEQKITRLPLLVRKVSIYGDRSGLRAPDVDPLLPTESYGTHRVLRQVGIFRSACAMKVVACPSFLSGTFDSKFRLLGIGRDKIMEVGKKKCPNSASMGAWASCCSVRKI